MEADLNSIAKADAESGTVEEKHLSKEVWRLREPKAKKLAMEKDTTRLANDAKGL